jgi:D-beta-D-heptose 7-phosphate kinase/D-beta-D-heptose 1-phosphate adenosyltransferase
MTITNAGLVQGRVGLVDAALIRWLANQKARFNHLDIHITQSVFEPVLPYNRLKEFLCALELVDQVLPSGDEIPASQQGQPCQERIQIPLPESDLLAFSLNRICKRDQPIENESHSTKLASLQMLVSHFGLRPPRQKTVGIVSGVFDVIHPGHIELIQSAKAQVDILVVLTMNSPSIRLLEKNRLGDRPIYSTDERVDVLTALQPVDYVLVFEDLNCLPSLENFCPDYFFKNMKDRSRPVVGAEADLVEKLGGKTIYLEDIQKSHSSTEIIEYVRQQAEVCNAQ